MKHVRVFVRAMGVGVFTALVWLVFDVAQSALGFAPVPKDYLLVVFAAAAGCAIGDRSYGVVR